MAKLNLTNVSESTDYEMISSMTNIVKSSMYEINAYDYLTVDERKIFNRVNWSEFMNSDINSIMNSESMMMLLINEFNYLIKDVVRYDCLTAGEKDFMSKSLWIQYVDSLDSKLIKSRVATLQNISDILSKENEGDADPDSDPYFGIRIYGVDNDIESLTSMKPMYLVDAGENSVLDNIQFTPGEKLFSWRSKYGKTPGVLMPEIYRLTTGSDNLLVAQGCGGNTSFVLTSDRELAELLGIQLFRSELSKCEMEYISNKIK